MAGKTQKATVNDETLFDSGETGEGGTDGRVSLGEMSDGQAVAGAFGVRECKVLQKKNGEDYVKMTLADASSSVTALSWDRAAEFAAAAKPGSVVFVEGKFSVHPQFGRQIKPIGDDPQHPVAARPLHSPVALMWLDRHADQPHGMIRSRAVFRLPAQVDDLVADDACVTIGLCQLVDVPDCGQSPV